MAEAWGYPVEVVYIVFKACAGIALWGMAVVGFLFGRALWWERVAAFAAGVLMILYLPITDEAGFALGLFVVAAHWWRVRRAKQAEPAAS